ncbi:uncharacterized protein EDB91DRAFT_77823 [Suillus paluster]|uniref:uncharacterized protein n=1 Tax=Suillus paluster TaxID=48578 RepID=UPI001B882F0B|nr:uncharacterized protein EDB91DRAFT_77823 [Suillus paluster]KAG1725995.1 hypothetical protein EDB91DRAFT_77823 [Suillus paluster]
MSTGTNNSSTTPKFFHHVIQSPERDNAFHAVAAPSEYLKAKRKEFRVQCTQCQAILEKPQTCKKCKSVWYCSKECQKTNWPTHKLTCQEVERSSGVLKIIQMFQANPLLMGYLEVGIIFECGLLDNPRMGLDVPFMARVHIAIEPSDILDFVGLYLNNNTVGEKLKGMVQVNAITPLHGPLPLVRLRKWRDFRAQCNVSESSAKDPVGLIEFVGCTEGSDNSVISELYIAPIVLDMARKREPFVTVNTATGTQLKTPMSTTSCLQFINMHIREDKKNQLCLRAEMTAQGKEVIRAAGRKEDALPAARILKEKMQRERIYANLLQWTH